MRRRRERGKGELRAIPLKPPGFEDADVPDHEEHELNDPSGFGASDVVEHPAPRLAPVAGSGAERIDARGEFPGPPNGQSAQVGQGVTALVAAYF